MAVQTRNRAEWCTGTETARLLDTSTYALRRIAEANGIRVRDLPGVQGPRYHRGDIMKALSRLEARETAATAATAKAAAKSTVRSGRRARTATHR
jgi:hypothetical protein